MESSAVRWAVCPVGSAVPWALCPVGSVSRGQCVPWAVCPVGSVSRGQYCPVGSAVPPHFYDYKNVFVVCMKRVCSGCSESAAGV